MSESFPWLKLDTDTLDDAKIKRLKTAANFGIFIGLLTLANKGFPRGFITIDEGIPYSLKELGSLCMALPKQVEVVISLLTSLKVLSGSLEDGTLHFTNFDRHQMKPSDSKEAIAERVQRHRERKSAENNPKTAENVTPCNALQNVIENKCNENVTRIEEDIDIDIDIDKEEDKRESKREKTAPVSEIQKHPAGLLISEWMNHFPSERQGRNACERMIINLQEQGYTGQEIETAIVSAAGEKLRSLSPFDLKRRLEGGNTHADHRSNGGKPSRHDAGPGSPQPGDAFECLNAVSARNSCST